MSGASSGKGEILVVDDYPANLHLLVDILEANDFDVSVATTGRRALDLACASPPDLILLDVTMPDMDGYETCKHLKADAVTGEIPVIFLSGHDDVLDKVRAFEAGGVDYITKPFHPDEVVARVESQLKISRLQRELERQNEELVRKNAELLESRRRIDMVFAALSKVLPGTVLDGRYRLDTRIGSGGFGAVFRATELPSNRSVAVKVFRPAPENARVESFDRFRLEGISACRVSHPNAVVVLDAGLSAEGIAYIVMELLEGRTLADELRDTPVLAPSRCAEVLAPVCRALAAAHAAGVVHRDIKPGNIFLHRVGETEIVKVLDFGTAKLLGATSESNVEHLTVTGSIVGTPAYTAPERLRGAAYDGRSDVYSVGVLLYRMLCGRLPFDGDDAYAVALMHLHQDPAPLRDRVPGVPEGVDEVVMGALAKDPAQRPTASELAAALSAAFPAHTAALAAVDALDDDTVTEQIEEIDSGEG